MLSLHGCVYFGQYWIIKRQKSNTHHLALKNLQEKYPEIQVVSESKVIHDSNLITSEGFHQELIWLYILLSKLWGNL